VTTTLK